MDIREIINAMQAEDKQLFDKCRTEMRKAYLIAHNKTIGIVQWSREDDAFMDMIDIKIATLFDRDGRITASKPIIGEKDAEQTVKDLHKHDTDIKDKLALIERKPTTASKLENVAWGAQPQ